MADRERSTTDSRLRAAERADDPRRLLAETLRAGRQPEQGLVDDVLAELGWGEASAEDWRAAGQAAASACQDQDGQARLERGRAPTSDELEGVEEHADLDEASPAEVALVRSAAAVAWTEGWDSYVGAMERVALGVACLAVRPSIHTDREGDVDADLRVHGQEVGVTLSVHPATGELSTWGDTMDCWADGRLVTLLRDLARVDVTLEQQTRDAIVDAVREVARG